MVLVLGELCHVCTLLLSHIYYLLMYSKSEFFPKFIYLRPFLPL